MHRQLTDELAAEVRHLLDARTGYTSVFQLPEWAQILYYTDDVFFITGRKHGMLNFFALVNRNGRKYYNIQFGPVCHDAAIWDGALRYMRKLFGYKALCLSVQPDTGMDLPVHTGGRTYADRYNWSTLLLDISRPEAEIFGRFSENHRRAVKKAIKNSLEVAVVTDEATAGELAAVYMKMYASRELAADEGHVSRLWTAMQLRFAADAYRDGIIFSVKKEGTIIGGIVITLCGGRAFYYMGCSDPAERKWPVLHIAFWEAIKYCRNRGILLFDFGGYAAYAAAGSQLYNINHFKKQFDPNITYYPERIYFSLVPFGTYLLHLVRKMKN